MFSKADAHEAQKPTEIQKDERVDQERFQVFAILYERRARDCPLIPVAVLNGGPIVKKLRIIPGY